MKKNYPKRPKPKPHSRWPLPDGYTRWPESSDTWTPIDAGEDLNLFPLRPTPSRLANRIRYCEEVVEQFRDSHNSIIRRYEHLLEVQKRNESYIETCCHQLSQLSARVAELELRLSVKPKRRTR